jgi:cytoskeletal protein RodZ
MDGPGAPVPQTKSGLGTIALVVALLGLLIAASWFAVRGWTAIEGPPMPGVGYVAMTIGVVFSLLLGVALMSLLFYSSRHGYDERASADRRRDEESGSH